jgi:hypothetical protein
VSREQVSEVRCETSGRRGELHAKQIALFAHSGSPRPHLAFPSSSVCRTLSHRTSKSAHVTSRGGCEATCTYGRTFFLFRTPHSFISFPIGPPPDPPQPLTHALVPRLNHAQYEDIILALVETTKQPILFRGESTECLNNRLNAEVLSLIGNRTADSSDVHDDAPFPSCRRSTSASCSRGESRKACKTFFVPLRPWSSRRTAGRVFQRINKRIKK